MAEVTIVVCDLCGAMDRRTRRYQIATGAQPARYDKSAQYDLCEEHAAPVEAIIATKQPLPDSSGETAVPGAASSPAGPGAPPAPAGPAGDELAQRKAARARERR